MAQRCGLELVVIAGIVATGAGMVATSAGIVPLMSPASVRGATILRNGLPRFARCCARNRNCSLRKARRRCRVGNRRRGVDKGTASEGGIIA